MSRGRRWTKEMKERTFYKFAGRVMKVEYILGVLISNILYFWHPFCFLSCNLGERICIINRVSTLYNINESIFSCSLLAMFTTKNQVIDKVNHLMGTFITSLSMYNYQWNIPCKEGTKSINMRHIPVDKLFMDLTMSHYVGVLLYLRF